jgi:hypothetical protein
MNLVSDGHRVGNGPRSVGASSGVRWRSGKPFNGSQIVSRSQICIPHRHLDSLVSHQFGDSADVHPRHRKPTSKGVSQAVPGKVPDPSIRHGGSEPMLVTAQWRRGDTNKNATRSRGATEQFLKCGESDRVEGNVPCVSIAAVLLPSYKPVLAGLAAIAMSCGSCGRIPLVPAVVNVLDSPFPIATTAVPVLHCRMHCCAQIKQSSQRQGQCP